MTQGSLYPALHRLEQQGWLRAKWGLTETGREAKFYALTAAGRSQLARELASWDRLSSAIGLSSAEIRVGQTPCSRSRSIDFRHRLRSLARGTADDRLERELALHLEAQIAENVAAGMSPKQARAAARALRPGRASRGRLPRRPPRLVAHLCRPDLRHGAVCSSASRCCSPPPCVDRHRLSRQHARVRPHQRAAVRPANARAPEQLVNIRLVVHSHVSHRDWRRLDESGALARFAGYHIEVTSYWYRNTSTTVLAAHRHRELFRSARRAVGDGARLYHRPKPPPERDPRVAVVSHGFWAGDSAAPAMSWAASWWSTATLTPSSASCRQTSGRCQGSGWCRSSICRRARR